MILDRFRMDGKVAIVTGAGKGIGACTAKALAEVGAKVVCVARTAADVDTLANEIIAAGGEAVAVSADVTSEDGRANIVASALDAFGTIQALVNNAGGSGHVPTKNMADQHVYDAMQINFMAPVYLVREVAPHMKSAGGGAVVNISSGFGKMAAIGSIPYGGAKAAQEQATRMLAVEYCPELRVNAIRVGAITTENMRQNLLEAMPGIGEKLTAWTPVARLGEPEDIAAAVIYLVSDASSYVTGRILDVDGGMVMDRSLMDVIANAEKIHGGAD